VRKKEEWMLEGLRREEGMTEMKERKAALRASEGVERMRRATRREGFSRCDVELRQ